MPKRDADNAGDDRLKDETRGPEEIRGVADEGEDEFEETEDLDDEEEEEDEGTL